MYRRAHWKIGDLPWGLFESSRVDAEILKTVKAAALVEYGGLKYSQYLCNVFSDDPDFKSAAQSWGLEEVQHGDTLGRYAGLADPGFDFNRAYARNVSGFSIDADKTESIRGSRTGELAARCMVEVGTSSFYTALAVATNEPLLKAICRTIATDEFRHYSMFSSYLKRYAERENISRLGRAKALLSRLIEAEDDELAFAYFSANASENDIYDRKKYIRFYEADALPLYSPDIVRHGVTLMFKASGFRPYSAGEALASRFAWNLLQRKIREANIYDKDSSLE
ncbi:MAG: ferritin-like domain-containing protein [Alphaproteobacteria bacterium]|nr:ferritin-like domain-containing protein [Alphaproteobacteria bacterium]